MKCPECSHQDSCVLETRSCKDEMATLRRRKCLSCGYRFKTLEKVDVPKIMVKKRDSSVELFVSEKIKRGLRLACRKRPVNPDQIDEIAHKVESDIMARGIPTVDSKEVGNMVMKMLKQIDAVAYLRYVSVCNGFDDVVHFEEELSKLKEK